MEAQAKHQVITKDMTIGEVISKYPSVVEPLLETGVHCVGCGASYWETLEQGLKGHGMTDEQVDEVMVKLNDFVEEEPQEKQTITITSKAAEKLKEILTKQNKSDHGLKIQVTSGGCAGFSYNFLITKDSKDDVIIEQNGMKVFVDKETMKMVEGSKIDYVDALIGAGFRISNPNATKTCGCGQSFH